MVRANNILQLIALALAVNVAVADVEFTTLTLSSPRTSFGAVEADSKVYFVGGFHYGDVTATPIVEVYDLVNQNMTDPLFLEHPRGHITPIVIEPNIYFVGGLEYVNPPFSYDPLQQKFISNGTGPTVVVPKGLALHNSLLIVMGRAGVDILDLQQWNWLDTAPLRDLLTELALPTMISHEGVVMMFGGHNVSTGSYTPSVWAYDIATKDLTKFPDVLQSGFLLLSSSVSNGVIAANFRSSQVLLYHMQQRALRREFFFPSHVFSFQNKTFLFNSSGVLTVDWSSDNEPTFQSSPNRLLHAFIIGNFPVSMTISQTMTVYIYVYANEVWNLSMSSPLLITNVAYGVNLDTSWHVFLADGNGVYGYNPTLNALYRVVDDIQLFVAVSALIPAEEVDSVYIFEPDKVTKALLYPEGFSFYYLRVPCAMVPMTRIGSDFLDSTGRVMNANSLTVLTNHNLSISVALSAFNNEHFVLMNDVSDPLSAIVNYNRVDIYNYVTGEWGNSTDLPVELVETPSVKANFYPAAAVDNKLVIWMDTLMAVFDPSTELWTTYTNYSLSDVNLATTSYLHLPVPVAQGSAFLRTGGNTFDVFSNGSSFETWSTTSPAPTVEDYPYYSFRQSLVHNNRQIFVTSLISSTPGTPDRFNTLYIYDVHSDTWTYQQLPNALHAVPAIALAGNYLLALQNDGFLSYYDIVNDIWSEQKLDVIYSPAFTLETSANITFIGGGVTPFALWVNQVMVIPHASIVSKPHPVATSPTGGYEPGGVGLGEAELIVAIVVPVGAVLIGAALLLILLLRRQKRRRGQSTTVIGLAGKYGQWFIPYEQIKFGNQLGQGASGQVFKGTWKNTAVALKISMTQANATVIAELELMMQLRPHPNVIQLFGFSVHPETESIILVIEFCDGGSLNDTLFDTNKSISMQQKLSWLLGMAKGLEHLHSNNIVHRDIAARNVLLHQNEPKITDFGMSRLLEDDKQRGTTKSELGPIRWMAPESLKNKEYSNKSDIWSFGILTYEIIAQIEPHADTDPIEIGRLIRDNGLTPTIPPSCPPSLAEIMRECWHVSPDKRISIDRITQQLEALQNK
jgi:predicted Ser/Thr protein kinase